MKFDEEKIFSIAKIYIKIKQMNNELISNYLDETVEILKNLEISEVILFGSVSKGNYDDESDIDLLIILDIDKIPETYEEKMELRQNIRKSLRVINRRVSLDLLVYTKKEFEIMKEEGSSFLTEISNTGKKLYEKAS